MSSSESSSGLCRLVLGPSSAGKSSFIQHMINSAAIPAGTHILMAYELDDPTLGPVDSENCIIHYNMLRPYTNSVDSLASRIEAEPAIARILTTFEKLTVDMLVCRRSTLAKRILLREHTEPDLRRDFAAYPTNIVFDLISRIDLVGLYKAWLDFFSSRDIPIQFYSSEDQRFDLIGSNEAAFELLSTTSPANYSEKEASTAISKFKYEYQKLSPYMPSVGGANDRRTTFDVISPFLMGASALDVGCGEGYFCFEMERRGFETVVGTELKKERFLAACALRDVMGSKCQFRLNDVLSQANGEAFDTVLLLNVLHHLRNPIEALHNLSRMCTGTAIIEFPTPSDPKFYETTTGGSSILDHLPVIGVSLLTAQDQTFLFTPEALRRICLDHASLFASIQFLKSPHSPSRMIAICTK